VSVINLPQRPQGAPYDSAQFLGWADNLNTFITTIPNLLATGSFSSTTVDITNIPQLYSVLYIYFNGVSSGTATRQPLIRVSTNNGSTFDSTAGNYDTMNISALGSTSGTLASLIETVDEAASATWTGVVSLIGYQAGPFTQIEGFVDDSNPGRFKISGFHRSASAINAIRFLWNGTGSFDAGTYEIYGIR